MQYRLVVNKKHEFAFEERELSERYSQNISFALVYDISGLESLEEVVEYSADILYSPNTDCFKIFSKNDDFFEVYPEDRFFRYSLKDAQFDQRADAAEQCFKLILPEVKVKIKASKLIGFESAKIYEQLKNKIQKSLINPVDTVLCEHGINDFHQLKTKDYQVEYIDDISSISSLSDPDIKHINDFFKSIGRRPTKTEILVLETYWSDHCRHTSFFTHLNNIIISNHKSVIPVKEAYDEFLANRAFLDRGGIPISLMELGTINSRLELKKGRLQDLDKSEEINACSIHRKVYDKVGGEYDYTIMFKNETHNHPTEIEPFGGAATCLGGAIRDPLSGRAYVYNSMRISGAASPHTAIEDTLEGKLPQADICRIAAEGFSSYGNQIGIATGLVDELYHSGYMAKRMEVGAVIAATMTSNIQRERPEKDDIILLIGGRTGRDGIGGATGSSSEQTNESIEKSAAEVQKGNAPEERKLQRLFRNPDFARRIKRCNDFGAGGVCVAVGELAYSLEIYLDKVKLKYNDLSPTEIAISESQERMAIVIAPEDLPIVTELCDTENVESTVIARVTNSGNVIMKYGNHEFFNIPRKFIDTNGARNKAEIRIDKVYEGDALKTKAPMISLQKSHKIPDPYNKIFDENNSAKRGLIEQFDNSIGAGTILLPFGGRQLETPTQVAACLIPLAQNHPPIGRESTTATIMSYGFNPDMSVSPFYMGIYSVLEATAKIVAAGACYQSIRLSLQEYFPKMRDNWNLPFEALLGASKTMTALGLAAIGGKDSMSGSYGDISVPPTLITFGFTTEQADRILSPELKSTQSNLYLLSSGRADANRLMPDFSSITDDYKKLYSLIPQNKILSAYALGRGGIAAAIVKMALGNRIGAKIDHESAYDYIYGAIIVESEHELPFVKIGRTNSESNVQIGTDIFELETASKIFSGIMEDIYPYKPIPDFSEYVSKNIKRSETLQNRKPNRVFIPVFPGTNSEDDMERKFLNAGANPIIKIFRNKTQEEASQSIIEFKKEIDAADILVLSGGFSAGDEPDGSAKFIASVFRNPLLTEAVHNLIERKGLILGVCNGFQALVRLGLIPYGRIVDTREDSPVLTTNQRGRHIAAISPVRIESTDSPWMKYHKKGDIIMTAFSHGEGRFYGNESVIEDLKNKNAIATSYIEKGFNGSCSEIEGAFAANGQIFGKMGHIERVSDGAYKNATFNFSNFIIQAGADYKGVKRRENED